MWVNNEVSVLIKCIGLVKREVKGKKKMKIKMANFDANMRMLTATPSGILQGEQT